MRAAEFVTEKWSAKYKRSIDCSHPKGFSQRAHCQGRKKHNEDIETKYQVVCDGTLKGIFTDVDRAIANAKSMFKHEKEYYHIAVVDLSNGKEVWSWSKKDLNEFAPGAGGEGGNYLHALASAWYNHDIDMLKDVIKRGGNALNRIIDAQEAVEKILARGIHCGDGKVRKYMIGYNHRFDGVDIQSEDHYEYSDYDDAGRDIDSRTGQPWGPYDVVEFSGNELSESINERTETDVAFEIDSEPAYNAVLDKFGSVIEWSGDYMVAPRMYWSAIQELAYDNGGDATEVGSEQLDELQFKGSQCTKDCSGHRAGYEWSQRHGGAEAASWSPSFNKGAWLNNNGF